MTEYFAPDCHYRAAWTTRLGVALWSRPRCLWVSLRPTCYPPVAASTRRTSPGNGNRRVIRRLTPYYVVLHAQGGNDGVIG